MGQIAQALGTPTEFEHDGQTYKMSAWTYEIQGQFERFLETEAMKAARRMTPYLTEEEKKDLFAQVNRDIASGAYTFGSELVSKAIFESVGHFTHLLLLCLLPNHPKITLDTVRKIVLHQMEDVLQKMSQANADPTTKPSESPETPLASETAAAPATV